LLKKLLCAFFMLAAGSAQAAVLQYNYTGHELFPDYPSMLDGPFHELGPVPPKSLPAMHATLTIDEKHVPGGDLAGKTLSYSGNNTLEGVAEPPLPLYLLGLYLGGAPFYANYETGGHFYLEFDENKILKSWYIEQFDYISFFRIDSEGDRIQYEYFELGGIPYSAAPGSWSGPTPIPLPATAWLMLGLIGGLGVKAWRARNQPAS